MNPLPGSATGAAVTDLITLSGLTVTQIGRLLGVSTRTAQNWAAGSHMYRHQENRLEHLAATIRPLGATPSERHDALLDSSNGQSLYRQLLDDVEKPTMVLVETLTVRERFGA